jgi:hypothetical protein
MHCVLVGSINSMASAMRRVETRLDSLESKVDSLDSKVDSFERGVNIRLTSLESKFDSLQVGFIDLSKQVLGIKSHLENVTRGLGFSMESYSAAWLIELLRSRGIQNPEGKVIWSRKWKLPEGIPDRKKGDEIEIDLFIEDPLIVVEVTSFLDQDEISKLKRLQQNRQFIESLFGKKAECFFACYDIDATVKPEAEAFAAEHGIKFITNPRMKKFNKKNFSF